MDEITKILEQSNVIAVVGLSDNSERPSHRVASYLLEHGYSIIPVNPEISEWRGMKSYPSLLGIKGKVDVVDIFRKAEHVPEIVDQAIKIGAKAVWMQLGVINGEAAAKARAAGLNVIMDRCMKVEHSRRMSMQGGF
ncbi:TPA: CoA-binding protein [Candidatus Micrarchaeota archaeon]|nr:CoA-binding protein [Candidatus Micrarchaeota archaeon]